MALNFHVCDSQPSCLWTLIFISTTFIIYNCTIFISVTISHHVCNHQSSYLGASTFISVVKFIILNLHNCDFQSSYMWLLIFMSMFSDQPSCLWSTIFMSKTFNSYVQFSIFMSVISVYIHLVTNPYVCDQIIFIFYDLSFHLHFYDLQPSYLWPSIFMSVLNVFLFHHSPKAPLSCSPHSHTFKCI